MVRKSLLLLVLVLAGCGGGGGAPTVVGLQWDKAVAKLDAKGYCVSQATFHRGPGNRVVGQSKPVGTYVSLDVVIAKGTPFELAPRKGDCKPPKLTFLN